MNFFKKISVVLLIIATIVGVVYAAEYLTGDPTIRKCMAYGNYNGTPIKIKVNSDGALQL